MQAAEDATNAARKNGRSVSDHASCSSMFDSKMESAVMAIERPTAIKYKTGGSCCSS